MLKIKFLGQILIEYNGEDLTSNFGGKTTALLCILILNFKKSLSREKITTYLWPESNGDAGKYNLRYNLWTIKKYIGADSKGNEFLHVDRERCGINFDYEYECDIKSILESEEKENISLDNLEYIYNLFTGDFMEGYYFNNCNELNEIIIFQRNRFEDLKIHLLKKLLSLYEKQGNYYKEESVLKSILEIDPYDEDSAFKLMNLYEKNGKRGMAILFYGDFKNRLITYLGIQPSERLKKKFEVLKAEGSFIYNKETKNHGSLINKKEAIFLKTNCIRAVRFFWLSDVLRKLDRANPGLISEHMDEEQMQVLKMIQPTIISKSSSENSNFNVSVPYDVKIVNVFIELILKISKEYRLTVEIENSALMDPISKGVYKYLQDENIKFTG